MKILKLLTVFYILSNITMAQPQKYQNEEYNYQIEFPSRWKYYVPKEYYHVVRCEIREDSTNRMADGSVSVMVLKLNNNEDVESMADADIKIINILGNSVNVIRKEEITLNDIDGFIQIYEYNFNNKPDRYLNINYYFIKDNKGYKLSFLGQKNFYDKNKEVIDNSLQSFVID